MEPHDLDRLGPELSAYLDGELNAQQAAEVERLLAESDDARRLLDELRGVSVRLRELPRARAASAIADQMRQRAESVVITGASRPKTPATRILYRFATATAAAAVLLLAVLIGQFMWRSPAESQVAPLDEIASRSERTPQVALHESRDFDSDVSTMKSDKLLAPRAARSRDVAKDDVGGAADAYSYSLSAGNAFSKRGASMGGFGAGPTTCMPDADPGVVDATVRVTDPRQADAVLAMLDSWGRSGDAAATAESALARGGRHGPPGGAGVTGVTRDVEVYPKDVRGLVWELSNTLEAPATVTWRAGVATTTTPALGAPEAPESTSEDGPRSLFDVTRSVMSAAREATESVETESAAPEAPFDRRARASEESGSLASADVGDAAGGENGLFSALARFARFDIVRSAFDQLRTSVTALLTPRDGGPDRPLRVRVRIVLTPDGTAAPAADRAPLRGDD